VARDRREAADEADRRRREGLVLGGETYEVRAQIKAAGGIWDAQAQRWLVPDRATLQLLVLRGRAEWGVFLDDPERLRQVAAEARGAYERLIGAPGARGDLDPEQDRRRLLKGLTALEDDDQVLDEWCRLSGMPRQLVDEIRAAGDLGPLERWLDDRKEGA
jgi:hypothetical protein